MTAPIDAVLARLDGYKLRENGRDRWRACCPAHGGSNPSALSVGIADNGSVLLRCWQGCSIEQIVGALGLDVVDLFPPRQQAGDGGGALQRRRMLTARQALDLLVSESLVVYVIATDVHRQRTVSDADFDRLQVAAARIQALGNEVLT
jgi:hypothetical protein